MYMYINNAYGAQTCFPACPLCKRRETIRCTIFRCWLRCRSSRAAQTPSTAELCARCVFLLPPRSLQRTFTQPCRTRYRVGAFCFSSWSHEKLCSASSVLCHRHEEPPFVDPTRLKSFWMSSRTVRHIAFVLGLCITCLAMAGWL